MRADLQARLADFLARKELAVSGSIEAFLRVAESTLSPERVKAALRSLMARFHRERPEAAAGVVMDDWAVLAERIQKAGGEGTIEDYTSYLFSVDDSL